MSTRIAAPEETRDAIRLLVAATVDQVATELGVSRSTVRRHLVELHERRQVARVPGAGRAGRWSLTPSGRAASGSNEPL